MTAPQPVRAATTLILWRPGPAGPEVLMGQRGAGAAFMASKFVFPGGAVDPGDADHGAGAARRISAGCADRLAQFCDADAPAPGTLVAAGLREMAEETGLALPEDAAPLRFVFRAITPPGRTRRFDARFLLAEGQGLSGRDFAGASGELSHLHWIALGAARALDLPFITEVVLAEVGAILGGAPDRGVPFFDNSTDRPTFRRLL